MSSAQACCRLLSLPPGPHLRESFRMLHTNTPHPIVDLVVFIFITPPRIILRFVTKASYCLSLPGLIHVGFVILTTHTHTQPELPSSFLRTFEPIDLLCNSFLSSSHVYFLYSLLTLVTPDLSLTEIKQCLFQLNTSRVSHFKVGNCANTASPSCLTFHRLMQSLFDAQFGKMYNTGGLCN